VVVLQHHRTRRRVCSAEATPGTSTSGANPPIVKQTIEISSSEVEHVDKENSSDSDNEDIPLSNLIQTRAQRRKAKKRRAKPKRKMQKGRCCTLGNEKLTMFFLQLNNNMRTLLVNQDLLSLPPVHLHRQALGLMK